MLHRLFLDLRFPSCRFVGLLLLALLFVSCLFPQARAEEPLAELGDGSSAFISGDGSTVVSGSFGGYWFLNGSTTSFARGFANRFTEDGSRVLVRETLVGDFLYSVIGGTKTLLTGAGGLLEHADSVFNMSSDGSVLTGRNDSVVEMAWITSDNWATSANVTAVPTPSGYTVASMGALNGGQRAFLGYDPMSCSSDQYVWFADAACNMVVAPISLAFGGYSTIMPNEVSQAGNVVVGIVMDASNNGSAAIWDTGTGSMSLLSRGGYTFTYASNANSDGSVLVGKAGYDPLYINTEAVYWVGSGGSYAIQNLGSVLAAKGVDMTGWTLAKATDISDDGTIIVGSTMDNKAFIANLTATGGGSFNAGVITVDQLNESLSTMGVVGATVSGMGQLSMSRLDSVAGGQGSIFPMAGPGAGASRTGTEQGLSSGDEMAGSLALWMVGSVGTNIEFNGDDLGLHGGLGVSWDNGGEWRVGAGVFGDSRDLDTVYGGNQRIRAIGPGVFAAYSPEGTGLEFRASGIWQFADLHLKRGYANGAGSASSTGSTDADIFGLTGRVQWTKAVCDSFALTPFAEYTWQYMNLDGYTESGGPFPSIFDSRNEKSNFFRTGLRADAVLFDKVGTWAWLAWDHRFENTSTAMGGTTTGLGAFAYPGSKLDQDWADTGVGASWNISEHLAATSSLGVTIGCDDDSVPDINATVGLSCQLW